LESIGCTYEELKRSQSERFNENGDEEMKSSSQMETDEDFFKEIDSIATASQKKGEKPLIIVDASNVAMRHGKNSFFSVKGIQIVVEYWQKNGH
jgi:hypothetical protein